MNLDKESPSSQPTASLSIFDACMMIVGLIVGAGIFGTPAIVAGAMGDSHAILAVWVAGGLISIVGALCYAELATAFPSAGGEYHFLQCAFGRSLSFLYGWARMTVIVAGSIAVFAYLFGDYLSRVIYLGEYSSAIWASFIVFLLSWVNYQGIEEGKWTQNVFTVLEVGGLILIIVAGFFLSDGPVISTAVSPPTVAPWYAGAGIGTAMLFVLFTYGGWNDAAYISAEVRGERNMAWALLIAISIVIVLYVLVAMAFLKGLGLSAMVGSDAVAADLLKQVWGPFGEKVISIMIAISALTSLNGSIIVGARSNYALGQDWKIFRFIGQWDENSGSPRNAMWVQGAIALVLVGLGTINKAGFNGLIEYSMPVFWGFFLLVGLSLFVLRFRHPNQPRPFRVPFYPVLPAIFVLNCGYLLYSSLIYNKIHALVGMGVLTIGVVVLIYAQKLERKLD